jgi:hypothetical protein
VQIFSSAIAKRSAVFAVLAVAYFVVYPQDLAALLNPIERMLNVSYAISPGLYVVIGLGIVSRTILGIWGNKPPLLATRD